VNIFLYRTLKNRIGLFVYVIYIFIVVLYFDLPSLGSSGMVLKPNLAAWEGRISVLRPRHSPDMLYYSMLLIIIMIISVSNADKSFQ